MDSKVIKPRQCFLERSYTVLIELNIEFQPRLSPIQTNIDPQSARHKNVLKKSNEDA